MGHPSRAGRLTPGDPTRRYVAGLGCAGCRVRLSRGCDIVQQVLAGKYPHGVREAVMAAAKRSGYLAAAGPAGRNGPASGGGADGG